MDTIECIQSVLRGGFPTNQVIVIDNGSLDGSFEQIYLRCPEVVLQRLPKNLGFAGGYNFGIEIALTAGAEQVFLLNNDTIIEQDTIQILMSSDCDVAVPKIYFHSEPNRIWSAGARWRHFPPMVVMRGYNKPDSSRYNVPVNLEYTTACALMVRREVIEQVGSFDPEFENYHEDYDFAYRVRAAGFKIGYIPNARVWHKVTQSLGLASTRFWWYLGRNSVLFYRKDNRFPVWNLTTYLAWITLRELLKMNFLQLKEFWRGVQVGKEWVKDGTSHE
jgi:GT2 family glycosyltransferase